MRMYSLAGLAIALDDLLSYREVAAAAGGDEASGAALPYTDEDGPLGLVERVAARMAGWAELLDGRVVPSFGPFSTADGSLALRPDLFLPLPAEESSPLDRSASLW